MKVAVWGWQFNNEYPGEAGAPLDDGSLPVAEYWGKTNDGLIWQSYWDKHVAAFRAAADVVRAEKDIYGSQGIEFKPWGVVRGQQPGWGGTDYAAQEGALAASIAKAAAGPGEKAIYIVDLEPYYHGGTTPQFWRNDLGAGPDHVRAFIESFRANGGEELFIAPDARSPHLEPVSFSTWIESPTVTLIMPQVYWTDFRQTPVRALDNAKSELAKYGIHPARVVAVTPGNTSPGDMKTGIQHAHDVGFRGVSVWRRGTTSKAVYEAIAGMADPWASKAPQPPQEDADAEVDALLAHAASDIIRARQKLAQAK